MTSQDVENLQNCLRLVQSIRAKSGQVLKQTAEGLTDRHGEDVREKKFLSELKTSLDSVGGLIRDLGTNLGNQQPITNPLPLGHSVYLSLDAAIDTIPIYNQLVNSYKWLDKAHDYSAGAAQLLSQNSLNRSYGKVTKSRRRAQNNSHTAPPQALDSLINNINRMLSDMTFDVSRPNGTKLNAVVEVTLEKILRAVLIFKGLMIEWVVVKGFNEEIQRIDGTPDAYAESRYLVFRRITENANAAMLNFQSPIYPELAVRSFMTYLHSFVNLFNEKCKKCKAHLHNNLPPTWREFKTLEPYHEDCRP